MNAHSSRCSDTSYLSERQHIVQFKVKLSHKAEIKTGVLQGSILGSLLFIMFLTDMMPLDVIASVGMYADDSTIKPTLNIIQAFEEKLNNGVREISNWCVKRTSMLKQNHDYHTSTKVAAFTHN